MANAIVTGQRIKVNYSDKEFDVIVIDPNGLGQGMPSVGLGYGMTATHMGIPQQTLTNWGDRGSEVRCLKLPSGMTLRVTQVLGLDGNTYSVIEASDWMTLAVDILVNPGQTSKAVKSKIGEFLKWFAVKGFYSEAYVSLKGSYTAKDSRATTSWLESRASGIPIRKRYTDCLQLAGCQASGYAKWTNTVYQGLFGMTSSEMVKLWDCVDGNRSIGRNYISREEGLKAVAFCEEMVVKMYVDNLSEAHKDAISLTKRKHLNYA